MKFARTVYWIAAAYGFVSLVPLYLLLDMVGRDAPPPITHPKFYYGFLGVTLLWQADPELWPGLRRSCSDLSNS